MRAHRLLLAFVGAAMLMGGCKAVRQPSELAGYGFLHRLVDGALDSMRNIFVPKRDGVANLTPEAAADLIPSLPGWGKLDTPMFGGYVTVDEDHGRALYYVLAQSVRSPEKDPLVVWLNGGPGCSSLGGGLMSELGPFYPTPEGKLQENEWSWHREANMLFIESPAFVGFSYSNTSDDATVGDERTAADLRIFLLRFLERFPMFADRPLYISGESYGGHYVPLFALALQQAGDAHVNLQGFLVGNAWTHPASDNWGAVQFWWTHALISRETADALLDTCDFQKGGATDPGPAASERCTSSITQSRAEMGEINIYDIYDDVCLSSGRSLRAMQRAQGDSLPGMLAAHVAANRSSASQRGGRYEGRYDPCIDNEVELYFNRPDVQAAMHANVTKLPWRWTDCSDMVDYSRSDMFSSMLPVYDTLLQQGGLRMLIFSGDIDAIVPVIGTRDWLRKLGLPIARPWRPWHSRTGQVGGYVVEHEKGLTFATVRHAGHMAPYTQPERSLWLFNHFVQELPL